MYDNQTINNSNKSGVKTMSNSNTFPQISKYNNKPYRDWETRFQSRYRNWETCFQSRSVSQSRYKERIRWMPWQSEAMKDVVACEKLWGVGKQTVIQRSLNGGTHPA